MLRDAARYLIGNLVFASLLAVGLQTRFADLGAVFRRPRMLLRALLVIDVIVPLLAILLVKAVPAEPQNAGVILLFAICPGVALLPFMVGKKGGRVPTAVGLLLVLTALAPITVPLWIAILNQVFTARFQVDTGHLVAKLVPTLLLPLALGMAVRQLAPRIGDRLARWVNWFVIAAIVVAVVVLLAVGGRLLLQIRPLGALGLLVVIEAGMFLGHWAGGPDLADRRAVAMASVLGNPALVMLIVKESYPEVQVAALVGAYVILRVVLMLPYNLWVKRKGRSERPAVPSFDAGMPHPRPT
jgi:BASS family bile acid:Na+ symporter